MKARTPFVNRWCLQMDHLVAYPVSSPSWLCGVCLRRTVMVGCLYRVFLCAESLRRTIHEDIEYGQAVLDEEPLLGDQSHPFFST